MVGAQLPRLCSSSLYAYELTSALTEAGIHCPQVAVHDPWSRHSYPPEVTLELSANDLASYRQTADAINLSGTDLVCVHYGSRIFGGEGGSYLQVMLRALRVPVVVVLHDVSATPTPAVSGALAEIARLADRLIVMSPDEASIVHDTLGTPTTQIDVIPYGVMPPWPALRGKLDLGLADRPTLLTHALLSSSEGIERVIDAMPHILERHPKAVYLVLGTTHPEETLRNGESYQVMLENRARHLRVDSSVVLINHVPTGHGLVSALAAADVYVSPCAAPERLASATLAQALGAGKAIVSTSYPFACSLLAPDTGVLVPWEADPVQTLTAAISNLLSDNDTRHALEARALRQGAAMHWPQVLRLYHDSFERAREESAERRRRQFRARTLADQPAGLPRLNLRHLSTLSDETGILHRADFAIPSYASGYRVDDNARALLLVSLLEDGPPEDLLRAHALSARYLALLEYAFHTPSGQLRDSITYTRSLGPEFCSEESHGRVLWALGATLKSGKTKGLAGPAGSLFHRCLARLEHLRSPRACSYALLGLNAFVTAVPGDRRVRTICTELADKIVAMYATSNTIAWPWFEDAIEADSAVVPHALLVCGRQLRSKEMTNVGLRTLRWLVSSQTTQTKEDLFAPMGSRQQGSSMSPRGAQRQLPTETSAVLQACIAAYKASGEVEWLETARAVFNWFLGQNLAQRTLYDELTGGCADDLDAERMSTNQGAEATLAFLIALVEIRSAQHAPLGNPVSAIRSGGS